MIARRLQQIKRRLHYPLRSRDDRQTVKDRALARRLHATFERDLEMTDVHGLHFYVQNGSVSLYGTLQHELDEDLLLTCVKRVPGVNGIDTENLRVTSDPAPAEH